MDIFITARQSIKNTICSLNLKLNYCIQRPILVVKNPKLLRVIPVYITAMYLWAHWYLYKAFIESVKYQSNTRFQLFACICDTSYICFGKGWPVDGLPFPDTGCPVPDVSIYYMSNINELPDGILFHWFCKCTPPWMFLPLDIPSGYRPEHVTFGLLCVIFKFPSRIFCRRVPGFATDCPCGVWCRGLTTCLLYVGPPLEF